MLKASKSGMKCKLDYVFRIILPISSVGLIKFFTDSKVWLKPFQFMLLECAAKNIQKGSLRYMRTESVIIENNKK